VAITLPIAASSSGDNTLIAASTGYKFRVLSFVLSFAGSVNAKFKTGASTDLTGLFYGSTTAGPAFSADALMGAGNITLPQFTTAAGEALVLNLSGAVAVGGYLLYERVPASM
jgi:hypothetical protein